MTPLWPKLANPRIIAATIVTSYDSKVSMPVIVPVRYPNWSDLP